YGRARPSHDAPPVSQGRDRERLPGPIRRVGVVLRRRLPDLPGAVARLVAICAERGVAVVLEDREILDPPKGGELGNLVEAELDLLVALGGDGTLLRAARMVQGRNIPVFGVNLGQLGFLTNTAEVELESGLAQVLDGAGEVDRRATLQAQVFSERASTGSAGPGEPTESREFRGGLLHALNDVVIHKPGAARVTPIHLAVGEYPDLEAVGSFSADGVIVATPTGSTAYSLSAGGPIIGPDVQCIVVTAICPHALTVRPLVLPATRPLTVRPLDPSHELQITVDGQVARVLAPQDQVVISRGEHDVLLVRLPGQTFFGTMRQKLTWAARPPERA
ncbi:MAG TPA: NAD(+)/NADH kinase, partial [Longimicrobiales bacterium]|nr:NAD(+)/NADH kinase [Longimicrobiales bacterium]